VLREARAPWPADAIEVGRIGDAWGLKGDFRVHAYAEPPLALLAASRWHLRARIVVGSATFFDAFDALSLAFVLPVLVRVWQITPAQIGWLIATGYLGQFAGALVFGGLAERYGRVRSVKEIATINVAWRENPNRRLEVLERSNLYRRSVRAKQHGVFEVKRVVQIERGMIGREVESREVVPFGLGLRTQCDCEAQLAENVLDLVDHQRDRMLRAQPVPPARHCEIDLAV